MNAAQLTLAALLVLVGAASIAFRRDLVALARRHSVSGAMLSQRAWLAFGVVVLLAGVLQILLAVG